MTDTLNRLVLALLGLLLTAGAVVGLLAGTDVLRLQQPSEIFASVRDAFAANPALWLAVAAGALLLLLLGLWLVAAQLRVRSHPTLDEVVVERGDRGSTQVRAVAVADALARDLERLPKVTGSRVELSPPASRPRAHVLLDLGTDAEASAVRAAAEEPLQRAADALGIDRLPAELRLRHTAARPRRVQ